MFRQFAVRVAVLLLSLGFSAQFNFAHAEARGERAISAFLEYCHDPEFRVDLLRTHAAIEAWDELPQSTLEALPWGIIGHKQEGWVLPRSDGKLALLVQHGGQISSEAQEIRRSGRAIARRSAINFAEGEGVLECAVFGIVNSVRSAHVTLKDSIEVSKKFEMPRVGTGRQIGMIWTLSVWETASDLPNIYLSYDPDDGRAFLPNVEISNFRELTSHDDLKDYGIDLER